MAQFYIYMSSFQLIAFVVACVASDATTTATAAALGVTRNGSYASMAAVALASRPLKQCVDQTNSNQSTTHMSDKVPSSVTVRVGDTAIFMCVDNYSGACSGSSKWFTVNGGEVESGVRIINSTTSELRLLVDRESSGILIFCHCRCYDNSTAIVDAMHIKAGYPPSNATDIKCWSNSWEDIMCKWDPGHVNALPVTWSVHYEIVDLNITGVCQLMGQGTCQVTDFYKYEEYRFRFDGSNSLGKSTAESSLETANFAVKPAPVRLLGSTGAPDGVLLWWTGASNEDMTVTIEDPGLEYQVQVYHHTHSQPSEIITFASTKVNVSMNIKPLQPFKEYFILIRCRIPKRGLYWSDPANLTIRTDESVPAVGPVTNGLFSVSKKPCGHGLIGYNVYWQGVLPESGKGNGYIIRYIIQVYNGRDVGDLINEVSAGAAERQALLCLDEDRDHTVTIRAATRAGNGTTYSSTFIQRGNATAKHTLMACQIAVEKTAGDSVLVLWDDAGINVDTGMQTVVSLCRGRNYCQGDIQWIAAPINTTFQKLTLDSNVEDYCFGVSRVLKGISSGITWAQCVYEPSTVHHVPHPPKIDLSEKGIFLELQMQACSEMSAAVMDMQLYFCELDASIKCNATSHPESCCQGIVMPLHVGPCNRSLTLEWIEGGTEYAIWLSYASSHAKENISEAIFFNRSHTSVNSNDGMRIQLVIVVCGCFAITAMLSASAFALYRNCRPNMKLKKIYQVPKLCEVLENASNKREYISGLHFQKIDEPRDGDGLCSKKPMFTTCSSNCSTDSGMSCGRSRSTQKPADSGQSLSIDSTASFEQLIELSESPPGDNDLLSVQQWKCHRGMSASNSVGLESSWHSSTCNFVSDPGDDDTDGGDTDQLFKDKLGFTFCMKAFPPTSSYNLEIKAEATGSLLSNGCDSSCDNGCDSSDTSLLSEAEDSSTAPTNKKESFSVEVKNIEKSRHLTAPCIGCNRMHLPNGGMCVAPHPTSSGFVGDYCHTNGYPCIDSDSNSHESSSLDYVQYAECERDGDHTSISAVINVNQFL